VDYLGTVVNGRLNLAALLLIGFVSFTPAGGLVLNTKASASQKPSAAASEPMAKLDFLLGEWKGKGWRYRLDGSHSAEVSQSTKVKRRADGSTLNIVDKKRYPDMQIVPGNPFPGMILNYPMVMSGPASLYYDEGTKLYYWRIETSQGRKQPFPATLVDAKTLKVKLEFPGSLALITISVTEDGTWRETLDVWLGEKDGWFRSQETVIKKVK
jgi:hypothetical protein